MSAHPFPACQTEGCCIGDCPACAEIVRLRAELASYQEKFTVIVDVRALPEFKQLLAAHERSERVCRAILAERAALDSQDDNSYIAYETAWAEVNAAWAAYVESGGSEARSQSQPASASATPLTSRHAAPACEACARAGLPPHDSGDLPAALGPRPCGWPDSWFDRMSAGGAS